MGGYHRKLGIGYGITTVDVIRVMSINSTTTGFQAVPLYVEDDKELNILVSAKVSPDEEPGDPGPRWMIVANPESRVVIRDGFCVATDDGVEYSEYVPTDEQVALFNQFARECV